MKGTRSCLVAKIRNIGIKEKIISRIVEHIMIIFLSVPRKCNFKQFGKWGWYNEHTYHNWFKRELGLLGINCEIIRQNGSGSHYVLFDPSFISKSGKKTPYKGNWWSGGANKVKQGLEMCCLAVADMVQHTAYHLNAGLTPCVKELKEKGESLVAYYAKFVLSHQESIKEFGNMVVADGYFGIYGFVKPLVDKGIDVTSCLKGNAALYYLPPVVEGQRKKGRPKIKGGKIDWKNIDNDQLAIVAADKEKIVRSAKVYSKSLKMVILLVAVDYLKDNGTLKTRKLYFTTRITESFQFVLDVYQIRFQIEFLFRDAKQFTGLMHCQSTDLVKFNNHLNLSLTSVSLAKATHWNKDPNTPFSMADIKQYYYNLRLLELFSSALDLDPNCLKNNPKILNILYSNTYDNIAA